jgi:hypothetical protein
MICPTGAAQTRLKLENRVRVKLNLSKPFNLIWAVQSCVQKYFNFHPAASVAISAPFRPARGAFRDRHGRWARNAVDADSEARRAALARTAKSCGPDAPTLASSFAKQFVGTTVATKPGHRGERGGNR